MGGTGKRRRGRLIVVLVGLNLLLLTAGAAWEYWRARPHALPSVNAEKIHLTGAQEGQSKTR